MVVTNALETFSNVFVGVYGKMFINPNLAGLRRGETVTDVSGRGNFRFIASQNIPGVWMSSKLHRQADD